MYSPQIVISVFWLSTFTQISWKGRKRSMIHTRKHWEYHVNERGAWDFDGHSELVKASSIGPRWFDSWICAPPPPPSPAPSDPSSGTNSSWNEYEDCAWRMIKGPQHWSLGLVCGPRSHIITIKTTLWPLWRRTWTWTACPGVSFRRGLDLNQRAGRRFLAQCLHRSLCQWKKEEWKLSTLYEYSSSEDSAG